MLLQEPASPGVSGELNLVGFSNNREGVVSAIVQQNFAKLPSLSWRLQGTLKKGGNTRTPDYWLKNTGYREQNFSAAAGWKRERFGAEIFYSQFNSEIGIFTGSHIGNLTDLENAFNSDEPFEQSGFTYKIDRPSQNAEHELTKAKLWLLTGDAGKLSVTYARQYNLRFEFDRDKPLNDSLAALNEPDLTYEITTHTADLVWEHNSIAGLRGIAGVSGMYQANTFEGRMFIPNYENYTAGVFLIERWKRNKLQVEAGLRYDMKSLTVFMRSNDLVDETPYNFNQLSATAGILYDLSAHARLSFNAGTGWRSPGVNELYSNGLHHGAAAVERKIHQPHCGHQYSRPSPLQGGGGGLFQQLQ
jgi:iron complex outermembrane receptor protein